jgi:OOP family OmpA-OmpF porin
MKAISRTRSFQTLAVLAALASIGPAGNAFAQQRPLYIGASVGTAQYDFDFIHQVKALSTGSLPVTSASLHKDADTGYKLTLGYQVVPQAAIELDYVILGKASTSYEFNGLGRYTRDGTYKISGLNLSGVYSQPINEQFSVFGRLGVLYSKYQYSESGANFPAFNPSPEPPLHAFTAPDLKRSKLSYGLGVDYRMNAATSLRLGWDRYTEIGNPVANTETGNGKFDNIDLFSLSVLLRF